MPIDASGPAVPAPSQPVLHLGDQPVPVPPQRAVVAPDRVVRMPVDDVEHGRGVVEIDDGNAGRGGAEVDGGDSEHR